MHKAEKNILILVGSSSWDTVSTPNSKLISNTDCPGKVINRPGGVILNIAKHIAKKNKFTENILFFSSIGSDFEGKQIFQKIKKSGISTINIQKEDNASDKFVGIENKDGSLFLAISDFSCIKKAEPKLLEAIANNKSILNDKIGKTILIDGNLSEKTIFQIFDQPNLFNENFNIISVSAPKSKKLSKVISYAGQKKINLCVYLNLSEANAIAGKSFRSIKSAAIFLLKLGSSQVVITDGSNKVFSAKKINNSIVFSDHKPNRLNVSTTLGAGDIFAAEHIISKITYPDTEDKAHLVRSTSESKKYLYSQTKTKNL
mgnify:CR=1 FL=1